MKGLVNVREMLERAYVGFVEDALKKGERPSDGVLRCCECGRTDVTLRRIHKNVYACTDCINRRGIEEAKKEAKKQQQ